MFKKSEVERLAEEIGEERAKVLLKLAQTTEDLEKLLEYSDNILENIELLKKPNLKALVELGTALKDTAEYLGVTPEEVLAMAKKHARLKEITGASYSVTLAPRKGLFYATVPDLKTALKIPEGNRVKEVMHSSGKFTLSFLVSGGLESIL